MVAEANAIKRHERLGTTRKFEEPKVEIKPIMSRWAIERLHNNRTIKRMLDVMYSPYRRAYY